MKKLKTSIILIFTFLMTANLSMAQESVNQVDAQGKRHGVWKKYYNNKRLRYQGQFDHGKEIGTFKYYSAATSENPIVIKTFNSQNDTAEVTFFTSSGIIISKGNMLGKKRVGMWLFFHEDGKTIMSEENYQNGLLEGEYKTFYNSGKPTEIAHYKNGLLDSVYRKYSIKGHLYQHFTYKNGKLNGKAVYYNRKTGLLTTKGQFLNDVRTGTWENYVEGELVSTEQPNLKKERVKKQ